MPLFSTAVNARRTESLDSAVIDKLVTKATVAQFGPTNILNLIEKAILAVTLTDEENSIIAHAGFFDYPRVKGVRQNEWETWFQHHYSLPDVTPLNTLFMHHFVSQGKIAREAVFHILHTVFNAAPHVHNVVLNTNKGVYPDEALMENFQECNAVRDQERLTHNCYITKRHTYFPMLHIRLATMEDNDSLTPIFEEQNITLKETYGDFFVAELVQASNEQMRCFAAEVDNKAVGFMSVCSEVNVQLLNRCYELGPFHGLCKPHPNDVLLPTDDDLQAIENQLLNEIEDYEPVHVGPSDLNEAVMQGENTDLVSEASIESGGKIPQPKPSGNGKPSEMSEVTPAKGGSHRANSQRSGSRRSNFSPQDVPEIRDESLPDEEPKKLSSRSHSGSEATRASLHDESAVGSSRSATSSIDTVSELMSPFPMPPPNTAAYGRLGQGLHGLGLESGAAFVPTYYGDVNAVVIQLYAMDEAYEMRSIDFMPKVFQYFPDVDYAIITVPRLVPVIPLLQNFIRVPSRPTCTLPHELYVFHRAALLKDFRVRKACPEDLGELKALFKMLHLSAAQLRDFKTQQDMRRDLDGTQMRCYVATCLNHIIGFAVVRQEEDMEYLRSHYNIEDFIYYDHYRRDEHGHLHHFVLSPAFHRMAKPFLKEIMRLDDKASLYYPLYPQIVIPEEDAPEKSHGLVNCLGELVPVRARRQIVYPVTKLGANAPSKRVLQKKANLYQLNHINRKLINEPKAIINARIVVVGASTTGLAFLESLIFCPHLQFTNLVLISPHGPPSDIPRDQFCDHMLSTNHCYEDSNYYQVHWRRVVNVVYGNMTAIQRKKKYIVVNDHFHVPYDHVVITTGLQYQVPCPTGAEIDKLPTNKEVPNSPDRRYPHRPPRNLFVVNDSYDASVALHWVKKHLVGKHENAHLVIVYGQSLDAMSCVQTLMNLNVPGNKIILVKPPQEGEVTCFNNPSVEELVNRKLQLCGIQVYSGYLLAQWNDGEEAPRKILSASFTSDAQPVSFACSAFFAFYKKRVDYQAFKAMNDACLVFDARLVIDGHFHTNDPCIRGAGPVTKYQRIFYSDQWTHARYNSRVVGEELARTMLRLFDPTLEPLKCPPKERVKLVPSFDGPKIVGCLLPGGYHYMHLAKPALDVPLVSLMSQKDYGSVYITGTTGGEKPYFRLHINGYRAVETITCISTEEIPVSNLTWLYGLHEQMLNNFDTRFRDDQIKDLYEFFTNAWSMALYHDRFSDFRDEIRELLQTKPNSSKYSFEELVRRMLDEDIGLTESQRKELRDVYENSGAKRAVEMRLLSFISYNYYHLPMYAKPDMV